MTVYLSDVIAHPPDDSPNSQPTTILYVGVGHVMVDQPCNVTLRTYDGDFLINCADDSLEITQPDGSRLLLDGKTVRLTDLPKPIITDAVPVTKEP